MSKVESYRRALRSESDWDAFLMAQSGLPGPRANLELVQAAADEGDEARFPRWLELGPAEAPVNSPQVFLAVCGAVGLGRLVAEGQGRFLPLLRKLAGDPRWRVREAVAMALQRLGDRDVDRLLTVAYEWSQGSRLEQRAAAAAVCEPRLLAEPRAARAAQVLLDAITVTLVGAPDRKAEEFRVLRQALGYCWSVAVAALPDEGRPAMEKWLDSPDPDVAWIMRENLKKNRLVKLDPGWVEHWAAALKE